MVKKDNIALKAIIIGLVMLLATTIIGGCGMLFLFHEIEGAGYRIRKIIYTDIIETYIEGKTLVERIETSSSSAYTFDILENGYGPIETGITNTYDFIISTDTTTFKDSVTGVGYSTEFGMFLGDDGSGVVLDNEYIFSGKLGYYTAGGQGDCLIESCTCGHLYDIFDKVCQHSYSTYYYTSETQITLDEARNQMGITCPGCFEIVETDNGDGTFYYEAVDVCGNQMKFFHDGTFTRQLMNGMVLDMGDETSVFTYEELILDGYDFGVLYDYVTTTDYSKTYTNWEQYYNPSSFSHMFSDLPVEKITIKRVSGLGERAKDLSCMFENCPNLKEIEFGNLFEGCKPTDISNMFYNCPNLQNIDLTTLDTSEVTNMSGMFATGQKGAHLTEKSRANIINTYINETLIPNMAPELNDGRSWTLETLTEELRKEEGNEDLTEEYVLVILVAEMGLNVPLSYNELSTMMMGMSFTDLVIKAQEDPTQVDLPEKTDGSTYTYKEVVEYFESELATIGISTIYDGFLFENSSREELINYVINETFVPIYLDPEDKTKYTLDSIVKKLNEQQTFSTEELTKEMFLIQLSLETGIQIPITWDELVFAITGEDFDDIVTMVNLDPSSMDMEPKADGTPYTKDDLISLLRPEFSGLDINLVTETELKLIYTTGGAKPTGRLILGGVDSKFVINEGTNITGIFGETNNFGTIVAPASIHESITLQLPYTYEGEEGIVQTITSADANKTFGYYVEEENTAKTWLTTGEIVAISVGGGSVFIGSIVALIMMWVIKKKPVSRY